MDIIKRPHDKFFKETFSDIETAKDFIHHYVPEEIRNIIDLEHLTLEKDSFIEKELEELHSDLLFKTRIKDKEGYIYILFEHKSYLSDQIALQLLKYMIKIWERKINKEKANMLPLIIPLVIYHGASEWNVELELGKLIEGWDELSDGIKQYIPDYHYILYDLSPYSAEEIKGGAILQIMLGILKAIFTKDTEEIAEQIKKATKAITELERQDKAIEHFETIIRYIISARQDLTIERFYEAVKEVSLEGSEIVMTIAEQLFKEGMEKGKQEGILEGMEKGLQKGKQEGILEGIEKGKKEGKKEGLLEGLQKGMLEVAKQMLSAGEPIEKIKKYAKLTDEQIEEIRKGLTN